MAILAPLCRAERKRMQKLIQKTNDKHFARRLMAMLMLHQGLPVTQVQHITGAARSSIGRWLGWYTQCGIDGLKSEKSGRTGCPKGSKNVLSPRVTTASTTWQERYIPKQEKCFM